MKRTVRILACLLSLGMLLGIFASCGSDTESPGETSEENTTEERNYRPQQPQEGEKTIDIYLIAGQSNAAGSSYITNEAAAYEFAPELKNGFSNILFSGVASDTSYRGYWENVKLGQGTYKNTSFGPEAGMAKALSVYYNEETGNTAGFIKVAFGGTPLLDEFQSKKYGSWISPSGAAAYGDPYEEEELTGKAYKTFLSTVEQQLTLLKYKGYDSFRIKGLYWMQGENDREKPKKYQTAFGYLVDDLRRDLAEIVKRVTKSEDDRGAADLPIWVGTISRTFNSALNTDQKINEKFIEMQKGLADEENKIFVVDNSTYDINRKEGGQNVAIGNDVYHWNQECQLKIGYAVGKAMAEYLKLS